jgi:GNAT superfamily N-acetyltransferase
MLDPGLQNLAVGRAMFGIEGNVAWCDFLVVDSPYRGLGIGEKMIRYVNQLGLIVLGRSNHEEVPEVFWSSLIGS